MEHHKALLEELLSKVHKGEANESERELVRQWLYSVDLSEATVQEEYLDQAKLEMLEKILHRPEDTIPATQPRFALLKRMPARIAAAVAAIIIILAGIVQFSSMLTKQKKATELVADTIIIQTDSLVKNIVLPDSTRVWLNAHSNLSFDANLASKKERKVRLNGEAYFEVKRDPQRPFLVASGNITTRVLGTGFNVQTYSADPGIKITLVHGSIAVNDTENKKEILLQPAQQLQYSKKNKNWAIVPFSRNPAQTWMTGDLSFNEAPLADVLDDISHRFNVPVVYNKQLVKNKMVTTSITADNKLEYVMRNVLFVHRLQYVLKDGVVHVSKN